MHQIEQILDFSVSLGKEMMLAGSSTERMLDTIRRICASYELDQCSVLNVNGVLIVSAHSKAGTVVSRQGSMQGSGIHLKRLDQLNDLSRRICLEHTNPSSLEGLLTEALKVKEYPHWFVCLGNTAALAALAFLFDCTIRDCLVVCLITPLLYMMNLYINRPWLNNIIYNAMASFVAGSIAIACNKLGLADSTNNIMITSGMILIPGIPAVNAVASIFCGNELNGLLDAAKVILETVGIVCGFMVAIYLFGGVMV